MPDPAVNIKVAVTGVEASKQALGQVGQAAQQAQGAAAAPAASAPIQQAAAAQEELASATRKSAEAQIDFNRKAQSAVTGVVGLFSPALANASRFVLDLAEGVTRVTGQLLAFAGAGAAIGGVIYFFQRMTQAADEARQRIEQANDALQKNRQEGEGVRGDIAGQAARLGLYGQAPFIQGAARRLQAERGVPEELAQNTALASAYAISRGLPFSEDEYLRGLTTRGMQPQDLTTTPRETIAGVLADASRPGTAAALAGFLADVGPASRREARSAQTLERTVREATNEMMAGGGLSPAAAEVVEKLALLPAERFALDPAAGDPFGRARRRLIGDLGLRPPRDTRGLSLSPGDWDPRNEPSGVDSLSFGELLRLAEQARSGAAAGPRMQPSSVTIINTNAVYSGGRRPRAVQDVGQLQAEWE